MTSFFSYLGGLSVWPNGASVETSSTRQEKEGLYLVWGAGVCVCACGGGGYLNVCNQCSQYLSFEIFIF